MPLKLCAGILAFVAAYYMMVYRPEQRRMRLRAMRHAVKNPPNVPMAFR